jgi:hypothetical protein
MGVLHQKEINLNSSVVLKGFALGICGQVTTPTVPAKTKEEICNGCSTYKTFDDVSEEIIYCFVPHIINGKYCPCPSVSRLMMQSSG